MFTTTTKLNRLDLLYLEEYEVLAEELPCICNFYIEDSNTFKMEKGVMHICSKSLIFESENEGTPLYKYLYRYCTEKPSQSISKKGSEVTFMTKQIVEIITLGPASPYKKRYLKEPVRISFQPEYNEDNYRIVKLMETIIEIDKQATISGLDPVLEITKLIMERQNAFEFDRRNLVSINERDIAKQTLFVQRILPLRSVYGFVYLTNKIFYFQRLQSDGQTPITRIRLKKIQRIFKRRFALQDNAIEFMSQDNTIYYFVFSSKDLRDKIYSLMRENLHDCISEDAVSNLTYLWQKKKISNFEYLLRLNEAAQRSFCDLSQYPVFPWTIIDMDSEKLDFNNPKHFRDLSMPIGSLNPKRLKQFKDRYRDMPDPKFLYGTHYSTPGYVIGYLIRNNPLFMIKIQSGRFDKPDRLFYSVKNDWRNCYENPAVVKELIPEFYGDDDSFLVNKLELNLGARQNGDVVGDVILPKWAKDAKDFLRIQREALECDYVSKNLHKWIDLIFGYKQRGEAAVESENVFNYMTYEGEVDLNMIEDPIEKRAMKIQINEYGQTPKQLFKLPHPSRDGDEGLGIETRMEDEEIIKENEQFAKTIEEKNRRKSSKLEEMMFSLEEGDKKNNSGTNLRDRAGLKIRSLKSKKIHKK